MKKIILFLLLLFPCVAKSQGYAYFNKLPNQILKIIKNYKSVVIMDNNSEHIHAVDTIKLTNLIFYFNNGICDEFVTTHQVETEYNKILNYLELIYIKSNINEWYFDLDQGRDIITLEKKTGYFLVREIFTPSK